MCYTSSCMRDCVRPGRRRVACTRWLDLTCNVKFLDKCANRHRISSNDTDSPQIQPTTRTHQSDSAQSRNHHFSELLHEIVTVQVPQPMIMTIHTHPARNQYFLKLLLEFTITLTLFFPDPCKFREPVRDLHKFGAHVTRSA